MSFQERKVICSPATQKLEKHQRLLAIIDLYNSLEQNRVMNNFLCWGLVDQVLKGYFLYLFQKNIQCVQNMISGSIDALERWYKKVDSKVSVCIISLECLH